MGAGQHRGCAGSPGSLEHPRLHAVPRAMQAGRPTAAHGALVDVEAVPLKVGCQAEQRAGAQACGQPRKEGRPANDSGVDRQEGSMTARRFPGREGIGLAATGGSGGAGGRLATRSPGHRTTAQDKRIRCTTVAKKTRCKNAVGSRGFESGALSRGGSSPPSRRDSKRRSTANSL